MVKTFKAEEMYFFNVRAMDDRRRRVNKIVVSYTGQDGHEYRKSYEYPVNMTYNQMAAAYPKTINS